MLPISNEKNTLVQPRIKTISLCSKLSTLICFWKWYQNKPLTEHQITLIKAYKSKQTPKPEETYSKFKDLLQRKISLIVTTVDEAFLQKTLKKAQKTAANAPEHFKKFIELTKQATKVFDAKSPLSTLLENPNAIYDNSITEGLIAWLKTTERTPELETRIFKKVGNTDDVKTTIDWMYLGGVKPSVFDHLKIHEDHAAEIFTGVVQGFFEQKQEDYLRLLSKTTNEKMPETIAQLAQNNSQKITEVLSDRLVDTFKQMEGTFNATIDSLVEKINEHLTGIEPPKRPAEYQVLDSSQYIQEQEQKFYNQVADAVISALFPEGKLPEDHLQIPAEFVQLKTEGEWISSQLIPDSLQDYFKDYLKNPLTQVFSQRSTVMKDQMRQGIATGIKSVIEMLQPREQTELMADAVLPSVVDSLNNNFVKLIFNAHLKQLVPLIKEIRDGKKGVYAFKEKLFALVKREARLTGWPEDPIGQEEFLKISNSIITKVLNLLDTLGPDLTESEILLAIKEYKKPEHAPVAHDAKSVSLYFRLVQGILVHVKGFGDWINWLLSFKLVKKHVENVVGNAILDNIEEYRETPRGILNEALDSIDKSLDEKKIKSLMEKKAKKEKVSEEILGQRLNKNMQSIAATTQDVIAFHARKSLGWMGSLTVKLLLGSNANYLGSVINGIYGRVLGNPARLKNTFQQIICIFGNSIQSNVTVNTNALETARAIKQAEISNLPALCLIEGAPVHPKKANEANAPKSDEIPNIELLKGIPASIDRFVNTILSFVQEKLLAPNLGHLGALSEGAFDQLKELPSWLMNLTKEGSTVRIQQLKEADLHHPLSADNRKLLATLTEASDPLRASELLAKMQSDPVILAKLNIPIPIAQTLEDYTRPLQDWMFNTKLERGLYLPAGLDASIFKEIYATYITFLATERAKHIADYGKQNIDKIVQTKITALMREKADSLSTIVKERLASLVQRASTNYTRKIDNTIATLTDIIQDLTETKNGCTFALKPTCHHVIRLAIQQDCPPEIREENLSDHLDRKALQLVNILFPQVDGKDGLEDVIEKINLRKDIHALFTDTIDLIRPFLTPALEADILNKEEKLLNDLRKALVTYTRNIIKDSIKKGIETAFKKINPEFFKEMFANKALPGLQKVFIEMMLKDMIGYMLPKGLWQDFAQKDLEAISDKLLKSLDDHMPNFAPSTAEFKALAEPYLQKQFAKLENTEATKEEIIRKLTQKEEEPQANSEFVPDERNVFGNLVAAILKAGKIGWSLEHIVGSEYVKGKISREIAKGINDYRGSTDKLVDILDKVLHDVLTNDESIKAMLSKGLEKTDAKAVKEPAAPYDLTEQTKKTAALLHDFVKFKTWFMGGTIGSLLGGLAIDQTLSTDHLEKVFDDIMSTLFTGNDLVTENTMLMLNDKLLEIFER